MVLSLVWHFVSCDTWTGAAQTFDWYSASSIGLARCFDWHNALSGATLGLVQHFDCELARHFDCGLARHFHWYGTMSGATL